MNSPHARGGLLQGSPGIVVPVRSANENKVLRPALPKPTLDPHLIPNKPLLTPKPAGANPTKQKATCGLPPLVPSSHSEEVLPPLQSPENSAEQTLSLEAKPRAAIRDNSKPKWHSIESKTPLPLDPLAPEQASGVSEGATPLPILLATKRTVKKPLPVPAQYAPAS
jgi:hypothetical protein